MANQRLIQVQPKARLQSLPHRINHLTQHLLTNKKDYSTQRALLKLVGKEEEIA